MSHLHPNDPKSLLYPVNYPDLKSNSQLGVEEKVEGTLSADGSMSLTISPQKTPNSSVQTQSDPHGQGLNNLADGPLSILLEFMDLKETARSLLLSKRWHEKTRSHYQRKLTDYSCNRVLDSWDTGADEKDENFKKQGNQINLSPLQIFDERIFARKLIYWPTSEYISEYISEHISIILLGEEMEPPPDFILNASTVWPNLEPTWDPRSHNFELPDATDLKKFSVKNFSEQLIENNHAALRLALSLNHPDLLKKILVFYCFCFRPLAKNVYLYNGLVRLAVEMNRHAVFVNLIHCLSASGDLENVFQLFKYKAFRLVCDPDHMDMLEKLLDVFKSHPDLLRKALRAIDCNLFLRPRYARGCAEFLKLLINTCKSYEGLLWEVLRNRQHHLLRRACEAGDFGTVGVFLTEYASMPLLWKEFLEHGSHHIQVMRVLLSADHACSSDLLDLMREALQAKHHEVFCVIYSEGRVEVMEKLLSFYALCSPDLALLQEALCRQQWHLPFHIDLLNQLLNFCNEKPNCLQQIDNIYHHVLSCSSEQKQPEIFKGMLSAFKNTDLLKKALQTPNNKHSLFREVFGLHGDVEMASVLLECYAQFDKKFLEEALESNQHFVFNKLFRWNGNVKIASLLLECYAQFDKKFLEEALESNQYFIFNNLFGLHGDVEMASLLLKCYAQFDREFLEKSLKHCDLRKNILDCFSKNPGMVKVLLDVLKTYPDWLRDILQYGQHDLLRQACQQESVEIISALLSIYETHRDSTWLVQSIPLSLLELMKTKRLTGRLLDPHKALLCNTLLENPRGQALFYGLVAIICLIVGGCALFLLHALVVGITFCVLALAASAAFAEKRTALFLYPEFRPSQRMNLSPKTGHAVVKPALT